MKITLSKTTAALLTTAGLALSIAAPVGATESYEKKETAESTTSTTVVEVERTEKEIENVNLSVGECKLKVTNNVSRHDDVYIYASIDGERQEKPLIVDAESSEYGISESTLTITENTEVKLFKSYPATGMSSLKATDVTCIAAPAKPVVEKPTFTG